MYKRQEDIREYEEADPNRDREIEVVSNTVIGYEDEASAEILRSCITG